jgi:hypothetical protein
MWRRVGLVRKYVTEELVTSIFRAEILESKEMFQHLASRWRRHVPPKRRFRQDPHGAISHKTVFYNFVLKILLAVFRVPKAFKVIVFLTCDTVQSGRSPNRLVN